MNMHTERQEVMLMTQDMVMFLLDLELKYFPGSNTAAYISASVR